MRCVNLSRVTKDEYETTEQFKQRLAALQVHAVIGSITKNSIVTFVAPRTEWDTAGLPESQYSGHFSQYDADNGILTVSVQEPLNT